jgi:AmmeMemoRadiSam system protein B
MSDPTLGSIAMETNVREPSCPGRFYPAAPDVLRDEVADYLEAPDEDSAVDGRPKAVIAPHAGYPFSGPIAGRAFGSLSPVGDSIERALLVGPSHFVEVDGLAAPSHTHFATPLGELPVDRDAVETLRADGLVTIHDEPHGREHALETHLPFLQQVAGDVSIVPVVTGRNVDNRVARLLETVWEDEATVVSISSDLSHYLDYETARRVDDETREAIERLAPAEIDDRQACGNTSIRGLLQVAGGRDMDVETLGMCNSGDTGGDKSKVVGYGAWAFG